MTNFSAGQTLAEITRSGVVESVHTGHLVILNSDGSVHLTKGDPTQLSYPRSTIKSIQTSAMIRSGLKLEPRLLALVSASHSGAEMHQTGALEILASVGLSEKELQNAKDKPLGETERRAWGNQEPTRLAMNCSGKHAGMLATCIAAGWPTADYLDPAHPLQVAIKKELENLAGEEVALISADGCGAPLFLISLYGLARAMRAITISTDPIHQSVVQACRDFPEMVAGENRLTTRLMREVPGLFMKEGAEGVEVATLADGRTIVFKISDGSIRPFETLMVAALAEFGIYVEDKTERIYGGSEAIGSIRACITRG
jgi:L-asparaginase II